MTRHEDINIEGWWTINFMGNYDGLGCVICRIIEIKEYESLTDGDKKYLFDLRDKNDIHKYKFKQAIGIVNQNEIKDWNIIDDDGANYSNELEKVTGQISLDNRFIKLYSSKLLKDSLIRQKEYEENPKNEGKKYQKDETDEGMMCLFEKLDMINKPIEYLIILKREKSKWRNKVRSKFTKLCKYDRFNLQVVFEDELLQKNILIKNLVMYNTLYVKLPKTEIWTPHKEWEGDYFDEQMNELITIFRSFNAKNINYTITKSTEEIKDYDVGIGCFGKSVKGQNKKDSKHDTTLSYCIHYEKETTNKNKKDSLCEALYDYNTKDVFPIRNLNFFYFWKHPEWIQQLSHRTEGFCNEMDFSHEESIDSNITKGIATALDKLNISFDKNLTSTMKYKILFNILYYY